MDYADIFLFINGVSVGLTVGLFFMIWANRN